MTCSGQRPCRGVAFPLPEDLGVFAAEFFASEFFVSEFFASEIFASEVFASEFFASEFFASDFWLRTCLATPDIF